MAEPAPVILLIEDDPSGREIAVANLEGAGYEVDAFESGRAAVRSFDPSRHRAVITDVRLPDLSGIDVLSHIGRLSPDTPVIVVTAYGSVELAVEAMRKGAHDYIGKPFNRDHLLLAIRRALEFRALREEAEALRMQARGVERPIVFASAAMRRVLEVADRAALSDAPVLLVGEPGVGKELVARRIHARSRRSHAPFLGVHCAAIPAHVLEDELFGGDREGAPSRGRLEQVAGGTLFLDEFTELATPIQRRLVGFLEGRPPTAAVGEPETGRLVVSTRYPPEELSAGDRVLDDLLRRVRVVEITVPPLRTRPEDVEPLARYFVERFSGERELHLADNLVTELRARPWVGNVRELENQCERLVVLCPGARLRVEDLAPEADASASPSADPMDIEDWPVLPPEGLSLIDLEKRVIERVLALKSGNVTQAATYLGVPRHFLAYRIQKYGIRGK